MSLEWMSQARCKDEDPETFFPSGTGVKGQRQAAAAERICRGCEVRVQCQGHKKSTGSTSGVWGGRGAVGRKP